MTPPNAEARRLAAIARANRPPPRATTRPGSETTTLTPGDRVQVRRELGRSGTWSAYDGRIGWVATVNRQRFPSGDRYVEVGVCWYQPADWARVSGEVWFRADELVAL
jgi:hypothetical protein